MLAANLLRGSGKTADYILTGTWGKKAIDEARREGETPRRLGWQSDQLRSAAETRRFEAEPATAAYVHFTDNETIQGVEFSSPPDVGNVPLGVRCLEQFPQPADSHRSLRIDLRLRPKERRPVGRDRGDRPRRCDRPCAKNLPPMLDYRQYAENESRYNTPPTFGIYMVMLICRWLKNEIGGLAKMQELNRAKAALLYDVLDKHPKFYQGHAQPDCRSQMNVTFRLPSEELEKAFLDGAKQHKLIDLKGHRSRRRHSRFDLQCHAARRAWKPCGNLCSILRKAGSG